MKRKLKDFDDETSISKIHLTFLKLEERKQKNQKIFDDFIMSIKNLIEPSNNNYSIYYFNNNDLFSIKINYHNSYGKWAYNTELCRLNNRDSKLDYLDNTDLKLELGSKFKHLEKLNSHNFYWYLKEVIIKKLDIFYTYKKYKNEYYPSITELLTINNHNYIFIKRNNLVSEFININEYKPTIIE